MCVPIPTPKLEVNNLYVCCLQLWLQVKPCVSVAVVMSVRMHSLSVTCHSLAVYSTVVQHAVEMQVNHIRKARPLYFTAVWLGVCTVETSFAYWMQWQETCAHYWHVLISSM